jgi:flagellar export protein FliJ
MAFQFSLDTVLRVRGIVEEREERLLQKILFETAQAVEGLAGIDAEIAKTDVSRHAEIFMPSIGHNLHASYADLKSLKQLRVEVAGKIEKLEQLRDRQFIVYAEARRNREMLTDMLEEKRGLYEGVLARSEQKSMDDNFIARRGRV